MTSTKCASPNREQADEPVSELRGANYGRTMQFQGHTPIGLE
jgi:hypothetical protein